MNTEKVGFHPFIIGHEGPYGEQRYSCTLDRTSAPDGDGGGGGGPPPRPPYHRFRVFPGGSGGRGGGLTPPPPSPSGAEVLSRVQLYLCSP